MLRKMKFSSKHPHRIQTLLLGWFHQSKRDLPWRRTRDPYRIWLSEIMLQQTRVTAVVPFYEKFMARFPTVGLLAGARSEEVLRLWAGLGYYRRARNLLRAGKEIVVFHGRAFHVDLGVVAVLSG